MEDLKIAVEEPRSWARLLTITVPAGRVDKERRDVARTLARRMKLPGFRQGKVPAHVLEKTYGPAIEQQTVEKVVGSAYREALETRGFQPISQGQVGDIDYRPGSDLTFKVQFDVQPTIELQRASGFRVKRQPVEVGDSEVARVIEDLRMEQAVWSPVENGHPEEGDRVAVEITPLRDASAEGAGEEPKPRTYEVVIGSGEILPSIEETLRELDPGHEREQTIEVRSGEDDSVTEKERIRVRLVEIRRPELPVLDDEFAASVGDFSTLEELRSRVREDLEQEAGREEDRNVRRQLIEQVLDANPFDVPDSMLERYLEGVLPEREGDDPERLQEMRKAARPAAERGLKRMLVIEHLADREGLRATEDEIDVRIQEIADRNERSPAEVRRQLRKSGRMDSIAEGITEDKVFEFLLAGSSTE